MTCKHDWVGDDECPYCENEMLGAFIGKWKTGLDGHVCPSCGYPYGAADALMQLEDKLSMLESRLKVFRYYEKRFISTWEAFLAYTPQAREWFDEIGNINYE